MIKAARALFAQVLDLPGGMRIETNHAFCQSILRRFPLEASIIPQFQIIEEEDNLLAFKRAFNEKIGEVSLEDIRILSPLVNSENFLELLQELQKQEPDLLPVVRQVEQGEFASRLQRFLKLPKMSKEDYFTDICENWFQEEALRECLERISKPKNKTVQKIQEYGMEWLHFSCEQRKSDWKNWQSCFLTKDGAVLKVLDINTEKKRTEAEEILFSCLYEQAVYIQKVCETLKNYQVYECTLALLNVFVPIWNYYQEIKRDQGVLHYGDLIHYTLQLLDDPGAAWILYKLDGGLDHILLDEVQDNSTEQWQIAAQLSTEFFSGMGSHEADKVIRTIFAVGDYKQSIYSFQGARPQEFAYWKADFQNKVQQAQQFWEDPQLQVSFRSSQLILDFVDTVFSRDMGLIGVWDGHEEQRHRSAHVDKPGRVEIWPLVKETQKVEEEADNIWDPLRENQHYLTSYLILAEYLADWIKAQIGTVPPYGGDPIQAGDILILIRKRSVFSKALIRALKSRNVPLANLVKTQLLDQIAVKDLLALCEVLLLPQDDLNLACVLKSPLGGLTEESLMALAAPRGKGQSLWDTLYQRHAERADWHQVWIMLSYLFSRVDHVTPYALFMEILGEYKGRAKLLARLGEEVMEAIDELLSQALHYEASHLASLQGFLYWLKQSDRSIKNEAESGIDMVRIMTVHGAKGLQGRLVILPDTVNTNSKSGGFQADKTLIWQEDPVTGIKFPLYIPTQSQIQASEDHKETRKQLEEEESNRLLYVALTRASEWLVIAGYDKVEKNEGKKEDKKGKEEQPIKRNWYDCCSQALEKLPVQSCDFHGKWEGQHFFIDKTATVGQESKEQGKISISDEKTEPFSMEKLPLWMGAEQEWTATTLKAESSSAVHFTPSRPDGVIYGETPSVLSPLQGQQNKNGFYRGRLIHELLQYLPAYPVEERKALAVQWIHQSCPELVHEEIDRMVEQVIQTIECPELKNLFDSESLVEQPITGIINGVVIAGQIDRMRILPDRILLCDFKSGRRVPRTVNTVPETYLKQMAAYWVLLKEIYPDRVIQVMIVWTDSLKIMDLPIELLKDFVPSPFQEIPQKIIS